jgi:VCBS repeat-containing protein
VNDLPEIVTTQIDALEDVQLAGAIVAHDVDGNPLAFSRLSNAQHGNVVLAADGAVAYVPTDANYFGTDSFTFKVSDGAGGEATGTVTINIAAVNDAPVLVGPLQLSVAEDGSLVAQFTATDVENDAVQFSVVSGGAHGVLSVSAGGQLDYSPASNYFGNDPVVVKVDDGHASSQLTVPVTVTPVNDAPVAVDDAIRVPAGPAVTLPLLANDRDVDGDTLAVTILSQPGGGNVSVSAPNTVTFTPDHDFNGPIRFDYRITDAAGITADATAQAVIGDFAGLYFISDETTVGKAELHVFDGLQVSRVSDALAAGRFVTSFSVSSDGSMVAYVVEDGTAAWVYAKAPDAASARLLYTEPANTAFPSVHVTLNHDGTFANIVDPSAGTAHRQFIARVADATVTAVAANDAQVVQIPSLVFNPVNDDFYIQAQVGGSPPPASGTGFLTVFRGSSQAAMVTQVSNNYPPNTGAPAPDTTCRSPAMAATWCIARSTTRWRWPLCAAPLRQRCEPGVVPVQGAGPGRTRAFDAYGLGNDGARVCFKFLTQNSNSLGPAQMLVVDPATPAAADLGGPRRTRRSAVAAWPSDGTTALYFANTQAPNAYQLYQLPSGGGVPTPFGRALASGEEIENYFAAPSGGRFVFGIRSSGITSDVYSVAFDDPGQSIDFATGFFDDGSMRGKLDHDGLLLAYSKRPAPLSGLRRLTLLSTQSSSYAWSLTARDSTTGVVQFEWAP